jgi:hypothetical protein
MIEGHRIEGRLVFGCDGRWHPESLGATLGTARSPCGNAARPHDVVPGMTRWRPNMSVTPPGKTAPVAQQLRLVDTPRSTHPRVTRPGTGRTASGRVATPRARRAATWGDWQLDARTRQVGKAGVAAARRALEEAITAAHALETHRRAS